MAWYGATFDIMVDGDPALWFWSCLWHCGSPPLKTGSRRILGNTGRMEIKVGYKVAPWARKAYDMLMNVNGEVLCLDVLWRSYGSKMLFYGYLFGSFFLGIWSFRMEQSIKSCSFLCWIRIYSLYQMVLSRWNVDVLVSWFKLGGKAVFLTLEVLGVRSSKFGESLCCLWWNLWYVVCLLKLSS